MQEPDPAGQSNPPEDGDRSTDARSGDCSGSKHLTNSELEENHENPETKLKLDHIDEAEAFACMTKKERALYLLTQRQPDSFIGKARQQYLIIAAMEHHARGRPIVYTSEKNYFIRRVFLLAATMHLVTTAFLFFVLLVPKAKEAMDQPLAKTVLVACTIIIFGLYLGMWMCDKLNEFPNNYFILIITTIAYSVTVGYGAIIYAPFVGFAAQISVFISTCACFVMAWFDVDFTGCMIYTTVPGLCLTVSAIGWAIQAFYSGEDIFESLQSRDFIFLVILTVAFGVAMTIELNLLLGCRGDSLGEDEYVYAAFLVYASVIVLAVKIAIIMGALFLMVVAAGGHEE